MCINLTVLGDELLLLDAEPVFKVVDLPGQASLRVLNFTDVQADDALGRIGLNDEIFAEIYRESVTQRLEEVVEFCVMAAEHAVQSG